MNSTSVPTAKKKAYPLRLPPDIYKRVRDVVKKEQEKGNYAYSINEFLTQLIENALEKK